MQNVEELRHLEDIVKETTKRTVNAFQVLMAGGRELATPKKSRSDHRELSLNNSKK